MFDSSVVEDVMWDDTSKVISRKHQKNGIWIDNKHFLALSDVALIKTYLKDIGVSINNRGTVNFTNCSFDGLVLDKVDFHLKFIDCEFKGDVQLETDLTVNLSNCVFKSFAKFKGLQQNASQLELNKVTFYGNTTFQDFYFHDNSSASQHPGWSESVFRGVTFHKKLTLNNVLFPMDIVFEAVSLPKRIESDRSTFKRLKGVMEHQHNFIDAAFFHSLELNEYRKELKKKTWSEAFEDKVVFGFNWYASKFSLSWALPFFWIVVLSVIFYSAAMCIDSNIELSMNAFFEFINPFSWNSKAFNAVYAIWFLHKLFVVPLVYLLIVAIKRKTKL